MQSRLLINEPPLQVLPSLAVAVGLNEAIVLQQLHYWLQSSKHYHDDRFWVYNSAQEWQDNFPFWSENTIRRAFNNLRNRGLVITGNYNKMPADRTLWYSIDYDELTSLEIPFVKKYRPFTQNGQMDLPKMGTAIPETTQETTTNKKEEDDGVKPATRGDVHSLWQSNMPGTLTQILVDDLNDLVDTYGAEEVTAAITMAVRNNGRSIRYVAKILENRAVGKDKQPAREKPKSGEVMVFNQYTGQMEKVTV